jgi:hypothetical protein
MEADRQDGIEKMAAREELLNERTASSRSVIRRENAGF